MPQTRGSTAYNEVQLDMQSDRVCVSWLQAILDLVVLHVYMPQTRGSTAYNEVQLDMQSDRVCVSWLQAILDLVVLHVYMPQTRGSTAYNEVQLDTQRPAAEQPHAQTESVYPARNTTRALGGETGVQTSTAAAGAMQTGRVQQTNKLRSHMGRHAGEQAHSCSTAAHRACDGGETTDSAASRQLQAQERGGRLGQGHHPSCQAEWHSSRSPAACPKNERQQRRRP